MYKDCRNLRRASLATTHAQESVQQKQSKKQIQKDIPAQNTKAKQ